MNENGSENGNGSSTDAILQVIKLTRKDRAEAKKLTEREARFLVDSYYNMQEERKKFANQKRAMADEPHFMIDRQLEIFAFAEAQIRSFLDAYTKHHEIGQWLRSITGIGPVIAAGLIAHLSVYPWRCRAFAGGHAKEACTEHEPHEGCGREEIRTAGAFWSFAGLVPGVKWEKGQRRPWNAQLKKLCYLIGDSFVKQSGRENCFYGHIYRERKAIEIAKNEAGEFSEQAAEGAARVGKTTEAYKSYSVGKLPAGHIDMRARRYAEKLFLSHVHEVMYEHHFKKPPPVPFAIGRLGHADKIEVPNKPQFF